MAVDIHHQVWADMVLLTGTSWQLFVIKLAATLYLPLGDVVYVGNICSADFMFLSVGLVGSYRIPVVCFSIYLVYRCSYFEEVCCSSLVYAD
jgi:hypothetical protein